MIGESLATCILEKLTNSRIFNWKFDSKKINQFFGVEGYTLTTSSLKNHIKLFEYKAGSDKELRTDIRFKDVNV